MRILCIHQNFPGQFREIAPGLRNNGHEVRAICSHHKTTPDGIMVSGYTIQENNCRDVMS